MTYDFKKENEEVETLLVIWVLYSRVLVPNRLGLKFWLLPSFPVCSQQLRNFSKIHLPSNLYSEDNKSIYATEFL